MRAANNATLHFDKVQQSSRMPPSLLMVLACLELKLGETTFSKENKHACILQQACNVSSLTVFYGLVQQ